MAESSNAENRDKVKRAIRLALGRIDLDLPIGAIEAQAAFDQCFGVRGKFKGWLRSKPPADPSAEAVWLALMWESNYHKMSIGAVMMLSDEPKKLFNRLQAILKDVPYLAWLDKDRVGLETMGVW